MFNEQDVREELKEIGEGESPPMEKLEEADQALARRVDLLLCRLSDLEVQLHSLRGRIQDLEHRSR